MAFDDRRTSVLVWLRLGPVVEVTGSDCADVVVRPCSSEVLPNERK